MYKGILEIKLTYLLKSDFTVSYGFVNVYQINSTEKKKKLNSAVLRKIKINLTFLSSEG